MKQHPSLIGPRDLHWLLWTPSARRSEACISAHAQRTAFCRKACANLIGNADAETWIQQMGRGRGGGTSTGKGGNRVNSRGSESRMSCQACCTVPCRMVAEAELLFRSSGLGSGASPAAASSAPRCWYLAWHAASEDRSLAFPAQKHSHSRTCSWPVRDQNLVDQMIVIQIRANT